MPFADRLIETLGTRLESAGWKRDLGTVPGCRVVWWRSSLLSPFFGIKELCVVAEVEPKESGLTQAQALIEVLRCSLNARYGGLPRTLTWLSSVATHPIFIGDPELVQAVRTHILNDVTSLHTNIVASVWAVDAASGPWAESRVRVDRFHYRKFAALIAESLQEAQSAGAERAP